MNDRPRKPRQRGVASLVVVAVLFLILSLVAAYTNRNLIFEQRTSGNLYRSTQAFEAAEAGVEWALTMLNAGRIDANCAPSDDATDTSFRQRYLTIDPASGVVAPAGVLTAAFESTVWPSCVFDGTDWNCSCPAAGAPALVAPAGAGIFPAFRVRFSRASLTQPGVVRLEVNGCTRLDNDCLNFPARAIGGDGRATVTTLIALKSGLTAPPIAALTVRGDFTLDAAAGLSAANTDSGIGGISVLSGGARPLPTNLQRFGAPGTPVEQSVIDGDMNLLNMRDTGGRLPTDADFDPVSRDSRMFASVFGTSPETYRTQPAAVELTETYCGGGPCTAAKVRATTSLNPDRVIWVPGNLVLDSAGDIGSPDSPVVLVVEGNITNPSNVNVFGVVYSAADIWVTSGGGTVRGAAVAEGGLGGTGTTTFVYDRAILDRLHWTTGSFVRVPGSWRDF